MTDVVTRGKCYMKIWTHGENTMLHLSWSDAGQATSGQGGQHQDCSAIKKDKFDSPVGKRWILRTYTYKNNKAKEEEGDREEERRRRRRS